MATEVAGKNVVPVPVEAAQTAEKPVRKPRAKRVAKRVVKRVVNRRRSGLYLCELRRTEDGRRLFEEVANVGSIPAGRVLLNDEGIPEGLYAVVSERLLLGVGRTKPVRKVSVIPPGSALAEPAVPQVKLVPEAPKTEAAKAVASVSELVEADGDGYVVPPAGPKPSDRFAVRDAK